MDGPTRGTTRDLSGVCQEDGLQREPLTKDVDLRRGGVRLCRLRDWRSSETKLQWKGHHGRDRGDGITVGGGVTFEGGGREEQKERTRNKRRYRK